MPAPQEPLPLGAHYRQYQLRHFVPLEQTILDGVPLLGYPEIAGLIGRQEQTIRVAASARFQRQAANAIAAGMPTDTTTKSEAAWLRWAMEHNVLSLSGEELATMSLDDLIVNHGWWTTGVANRLDLPGPVAWSAKRSPRFSELAVLDWARLTGCLDRNGNPSSYTALRVA